MATPDLVVLDLGNVLIRYDAVPAVAAGVGEEEARAFLTSEVDFAAWNHAQDQGRSWADADAWLAEHHPRWRAHGLAYREHFAASLLGPVEGSAEVLRDLHDQGTPTLALTNWSAETFPLALERFPELALFDDVVVSGEVGLAKPDPAIYALTADRAGRRPEQCFFADDLEANVAAAREAGWDAELFVDATRLRAQLVERGLLRP